MACFFFFFTKKNKSQLLSDYCRAWPYSVKLSATSAEVSPAATAGSPVVSAAPIPSAAVRGMASASCTLFLIVAVA